MTTLSLFFLLIAIQHCRTSSSASSPPPPSPHPLTGDALYADVKTYASFATHRTGTDAERASSQWIQRSLEAAGLIVSTRPVQLDAFFAFRECTVHLELAADCVECRRTIDCFPLWFPNTSVVPPDTRVALWNSSGRASWPDDRNARARATAAVVSCVDATSTREYGRPTVPTPCGAAIDSAIAAGAAAVLVINANFSRSSPAAINVPYSTSPTAVPIVVVGAADKDMLVSAAVNGGRLDALLIEGETETSRQSFNLMATTPALPGRNCGPEDQRHVVFSTPISGWFRCGGERGPGVALFLGLARWVMANRHASFASCLRFHFFGDTGHELDDLGASLTLQALPSLGLTPDSVASWLHLGASIATFASFDNNSNYSTVGPSGVQLATAQFSTPALGEAVAGPLAAAGFAPEPTSANSTEGELRDITDAGFEAWGFFGGFERFHTDLDDASSTSSAVLDPVGKAVAEAMQRVLKLAARRFQAGYSE